MPTDSSHPSPEAIARELTERAIAHYGPETARALDHQISETAKSIALVSAIPLDRWSDEPDFLVASQRQER
jgi:hypothetical protein